MNKYNWGIIGAGNIAGSFAEDLKLLPQARLKAVSSRSADRASSFAKKYYIRNYSFLAGIRTFLKNKSEHTPRPAKESKKVLGIKGS